MCPASPSTPRSPQLRLSGPILPMRTCPSHFHATEKTHRHHSGNRVPCFPADRLFRHMRLPLHTLPTRRIVLVRVQPSCSERGRSASGPSGDGASVFGAIRPVSAPRDARQGGKARRPPPSDQDRPRTPSPGCSAGTAPASSARRSSPGAALHPQADPETLRPAAPHGATAQRRRAAPYRPESPKNGPTQGKGNSRSFPVCAGSHLPHSL